LQHLGKRRDLVEARVDDDQRRLQKVRVADAVHPAHDGVPGGLVRGRRADHQDRDLERRLTPELPQQLIAADRHVADGRVLLGRHGAGEWHQVSSVVRR
jgi:hypothetical protein